MPVERQAERLSTPLRGADRRFLAALGVVALLAIAGAILWSVERARDESSARCFTATFAASVGGATVHYCGDDAVRYCRVNASAAAVADACRQAGFEVGPS